MDTDIDTQPTAEDFVPVPLALIIDRMREKVSTLTADYAVEVASLQAANMVLAQENQMLKAQLRALTDEPSQMAATLPPPDGTSIFTTVIPSPHTHDDPSEAHAHAHG